LILGPDAAGSIAIVARQQKRQQADGIASGSVLHHDLFLLVGLRPGVYGLPAH